jgi:hypothetical protein
MDGGHGSGSNMRCLPTYSDMITLLLTKGTPPPWTTSSSSPTHTTTNTGRPS